MCFDTVDWRQKRKKTQEIAQIAICPLSSNRQHLNCDDFLKDVIVRDYQNCLFLNFGQSEPIA